MNYTIQFNLYIDDERILTGKEIKEVIDDALNATAVTVSDFRLLDVND